MGLIRPSGQEGRIPTGNETYGRMLLSLRTFVCAASLVALDVVAASAQPAGRLAGVVRDATGSVLPGVALTVAGPL